MKKLVLLLGLFMILPFCKMQAWDVESYFGVKIGQGKSTVMSTLNQFAAKVNKLKGTSSIKPVKMPAVLDNVESYTLTYSGNCDGRQNEISLLYPVYSGDNLHFTDSITVFFYNNQLFMLDCSEYVSDNNGGRPLGITDLAPKFTRAGNYEAGDIDYNEGDDYGQIIWYNSYSESIRQGLTVLQDYNSSGTTNICRFAIMDYYVLVGLSTDGN